MVFKGILLRFKYMGDNRDDILYLIKLYIIVSYFFISIELVKYKIICD